MADMDQHIITYNTYYSITSMVSSDYWLVALWKNKLESFMFASIFKPSLMYESTHAPMISYALIRQW
jgi:hypothetical protein